MYDIQSCKLIFLQMQSVNTNINPQAKWKIGILICGEFDMVVHDIDWYVYNFRGLVHASNRISRQSFTRSKMSKVVFVRDSRSGEHFVLEQVDKNDVTITKVGSSCNVLLTSWFSITSQLIPYTYYYIDWNWSSISSTKILNNVRAEIYKFIDHYTCPFKCP